jgi:tetratricopeptide (TPR) repeat protein
MSARLASLASIIVVGLLTPPLVGDPVRSTAQPEEAARQPAFDPAYAVGIVEGKTPAGFVAISGVLIAPDLVVTFFDALEHVREATFLPACCEELKVTGVTRIFEAQHLIVLRVERPAESRAKFMPIADHALQVGEEVFYSVAIVRDVGVMATPTRVERADEWPVEGTLARVRASAESLAGGGVVYDALGRARGLMIASDTPHAPLVVSIPPDAGEPEFELTLEEFAAREPSRLALARRQARESNDLEPRASIRGMRAALSMEPDLWLTRRWLAAQLDVAGNREDALTEIDALIADVPQYTSAHQSRGLILAAMGRFEEAAAAFEGAIGLDAKYPDAHAMHGVALAQLGELDAAIEAGMRSIDLGGTKLHFLENLVDFLNKADRLAEAPKVARTFCDHNTASPAAWVLLARLHFATDDPEGAAKACRDGIEFNPGDAELHLMLAVAIMESDTEGAKAALKRFLELAPANHPARRVAQQELDRLGG